MHDQSENFKEMENIKSTKQNSELNNTVAELKIQQMDSIAVLIKEEKRIRELKT